MQGDAAVGSWRWARCLGTWLLAALMACFACPPRAWSAEADESDGGNDHPGYFFPIEGATDCSFDQTRNRLYVTTPEKLVVADTQERRIVESVELLGHLQGCDISPDFEFLAVAPIQGQFIYRVGLDWEEIDDMEISQVKFRGEPAEKGVFSLCVGFDDSVLFSTTYAGSGWVKLRRLAPDDKIEVVGDVRMDSVLTASGERRYAAVAEGNISSGPLHVYDFKQQKLSLVANLDCFHYEIGCARGARYFARPHGEGCDLYDRAGIRLGTLEGASVICATFHPTSDSLFVLRHGEKTVQEYDVKGQEIANNYPLDKPLVITGEVHVAVSVWADLHPLGFDTVSVNVRPLGGVNFDTYRSGRLKISEDGKSLFAVIPAGVYMFPVKAAAPSAARGRGPKIRVIDSAE